MTLFGKDGGELMDLARELIQKNGGLQGLKEKLDGAGLGDVVDSWIGTGENKPVAGQQLSGALGQDQLQGLANKAGLEIEKLLPMLANLLPQVVDKATPDGDEARADEKIGDKQGLQDMLGDLLKGGLGDLLK